MTVSVTCKERGAKDSRIVSRVIQVFISALSHVYTVSPGRRVKQQLATKNTSVATLPPNSAAGRKDRETKTQRSSYLR